MGQEVREKRRVFGCVAARVSPLRFCSVTLTIFIGIDSLKYSVLKNSGGEINLETNNFATQGTVDTCTASQHQENSLYIFKHAFNFSFLRPSGLSDLNPARMDLESL